MYFNLLYFISKHFQFIVVIGIAAIFLVAISIGIILFVKFHRQKDWIDYANDCVLDYLCENETDFQDDKTQEPRMNIRFLNNRLSELINRINKETTDHENSSPNHHQPRFRSGLLRAGPNPQSGRQSQHN